MQEEKQRLLRLHILFQSKNHVFNLILICFVLLFAWFCFFLLCILLSGQSNIYKIKIL